MSNAQKRVNQQLAWCSTLVEHFGSKQAPWLEQMLTQTLTWHLQATYAAFLQELAESQRLSIMAVSSVSSLISAVPTGRACPLEYEEIRALEQSDSWLSQLLAQPHSPVVNVTCEVMAPTVDLIAVSGRVEWNLSLAQEALRQLNSLLERNRTLADEC